MKMLIVQKWPVVLPAFLTNPKIIAHDIKTCHTISLRKQIKGNDSQWLETSFKYLVRYFLGESSVCDALSLPACITYSCYS